MFRLVIAVPATSHPSERAAARVRESGGECPWMRRLQTHSESYAVAFTHALLPVVVSVSLRPGRARAHRFYSMSRYSRRTWTFGMGASSGCANGIARADEIVDCDPAMCFPITLNRPTQGIPTEYRRRKQAMGIVKQAAWTIARWDLSAEPKTASRMGIRDSAPRGTARCYQFLVADRKVFQTRNTYYSYVSRSRLVRRD